ncbi:MAG: phosphoglycerate dehydrogenase [Candidatus Hydrothermarchaeaceae archaeon]
MKVLVSDQLHKAGIELLESAAEVEVATDLEKDELIDRIKDKDALLVRSATKVTSEVIKAGEKLKAIGRAGVGVDNIDLDAATKKGIVVVNSPTASSITVAEHTIGLMLSLARKIPFADRSLKSKKWEKKRFVGVELRGKTLGIIGVGRIGNEVAKKAKAFEMEIIAYDPYISEKAIKKFGIEVVNLDTLFSESDFITLHVPLTEDTRHIIGKNAILKMKDGVRIVNCARGGIIDENALLEGLESGKIGGAALDVFENEPPLESPLLENPKFIATPHLGASTEEAQRFASLIACEEVIKVLKNEPPKYSVNMPVFSSEVIEEVKEFLPLVETIGRFTSQILSGRMSDISITYCGKLLEITDLGILTNSILKGLLSPILTEGITLINAPTVAKNRGIGLTEGKREDSEKFQNLMVLRAKTSNEDIEVEGTILGGEARIVSIEGYAIDLIPRGKILIVKHKDRPGMIGKIATSLGEHDINIGSMQVGRKQVGEIQLMVLTIDNKISKEALEDITSVDGIERVKFVEI